MTSSLSLDWTGDLTFVNSPGSPAIALHSSTPGLPSPVDALGYAIMSCMAMDIVYVVRRGRHRLDAMRVGLDGERAAEPPRRFVSIDLAFDLTTSAPPVVVERAIRLSRERYCSVWHTIRPDVLLSTHYTITAVEPLDGPAA